MRVLYGFSRAGDSCTGLTLRWRRPAKRHFTNPLSDPLQTPPNPSSMTLTPPRAAVNGNANVGSKNGNGGCPLAVPGRRRCGHCLPCHAAPAPPNRHPPPWLTPSRPCPMPAAAVLSLSQWKQQLRVPQRESCRRRLAFRMRARCSAAHTRPASPLSTTAVTTNRPPPPPLPPPHRRATATATSTAEDRLFGRANARAAFSPPAREADAADTTHTRTQPFTPLHYRALCMNPPVPASHHQCVNSHVVTSPARSSQFQQTQCFATSCSCRSVTQAELNTNCGLLLPALLCPGCLPL